MKEKEQWKRPEDVETFRTSDPKAMLGKYLPKAVFKTWTETFVDSDTGAQIPIERNQILVERGEITQGKLQEIMFAIQTGDIDDVEVCSEDVADMALYVPSHYRVFNVEFVYGIDKKEHYAVYAQTIPQAIRIATEFGQVYRGICGKVNVLRVMIQDVMLIPDDHQCIPEENRTPAYERKDYFKVEVRTEWREDDKVRKVDAHYSIAASEVGEAKERVSRMLDIKRAEAEARGEHDGRDVRVTIRKAVPYEVDCVVPREFSDLYYEKESR